MANENFKTQVITAAQKLFQERGLGMVTMEDVAKAVGKGKSTLYYYFKSKEEIFNAVLDSEINDVVVETLKRLSLHDILIDKLKAFAHTKFEMVQKRKSLYKAMEAGMDAEAFSQYMEAKKEIHQKYLQKEILILQQVFFNAMQRDEIPEMDIDQTEKKIFLFLSSIRGINREFVVHGNPEDDGKDTLDLFCELYYRGIR
ncbi:TetR/AcrR family transcriptional regulator [Chryseobacterium polytrichastri]|uniref:Transcriptional regulator, TetR family n=1 Tax=Chryseobacterium polytrichastri TaxID=1302687 RepID=A0A1M7FI95_9FLAO|nr:TetR/AcrR family transcriptional regulator [Chryseobacterium polytrichastri]SHM03419.1 transcriptional regulator, TetR family [Chryseobacterium polytrichastri]